jgi:hypothetical protein
LLAEPGACEEWQGRETLGKIGLSLWPATAARARFQRFGKGTGPLGDGTMDLFLLLAQQAQDGGNAVLSGALSGAIFGGIIGGVVGLVFWAVRKFGGGGKPNP